ncbi:MAG: hypothetical protein J5507_04345 [Clostridia bacterium]|nr:hypothetical protein [Clostridia bacterium]
MKKQNGITLIALIITIIVMLILVGVTINVALNGGLFKKAEEAKIETNLAKEKEILQTTALGYLENNGYVDLAEFVSKENPLEGYTLTNNTEYVTASKGTNTFYITKQGGLTEQEPQITPTVTGSGYTLKADPSSVLQGYDGSKNEEFNFYINYDTEEEQGIEVEIKQENGIYYIFINYNEEEVYIYSLSNMTSFDDESLNITGETWNKIIIGENGLMIDEEFNQSKFPIFDGYLTYDEKNEENSGKTLEAVNEYFGEIFVPVQ